MSYTPQNWQTGETITAEKLNNMVQGINGAITTAENSAATVATFVGSPLKAATVSAMTDTNKIYVYTGNESGMTAGHWYYYNGSSWADGGVYNAVAVETDTTLSVAGAAADAAAVGKLKSALMPFNFANLLALYPLVAPRTFKGITLLALGNGQYSVSGTATDTANFDFYTSSSTLPNGFVPGKTYYGRLNSTKAKLYVYDYTSSASLLFDSSRGDTQFTLPANCTGIILRLHIYRNTTIDEILTPIISESSMTDSEMEQSIKTLIDQAITEQGLASNAFASCDNAPDNSVYFVSSSGGRTSPEDFPFAFPGFLVTVAYSSNIKAQLAIPYDNTHDIVFRIKQNPGIWKDWTASQSRTIYVTGDTYNNEYNISTSPTITTDSHGWLAPVDDSTTQESNATDMTGAIMSLLNSTGYCHLAPGIYYVSGNIDMPFGSTLEGCGHDTVVRLLSSTTSGYVVKATRHSTIKNIRFSGGSTAPDLTSADIGGRHGIAFIDDVSESGSLPYVRPCVITQCWFENFSGAGMYLNDSGGGLNQGVIASDCYIEFCKVGIDIWYYSEYHKFTNIVIYHCYYGCINNGGNNVFMGCTFHATIGFLIDNASSNLRNPGHGSAVGCTFNHIDDWNRQGTNGGGVAISIVGNLVGFVFTGCQIFYGTIEIINSAGVLVSNSQIGGNPSITVEGDYPGYFEGCIFHGQPTLDVNSQTKFINCYLHDSGTPVS